MIAIKRVSGEGKFGMLILKFGAHTAAADQDAAFLKAISRKF